MLWLKKPIKQAMFRMELAHFREGYSFEKYIAGNL